MPPPSNGYANSRYDGQGWGLTNDGRQIYMSDGTAEIRVWNADTQEVRRVTVHDGSRNHRHAERTRMDPRRNLG